jgi:hypothetical protein
MSGVVRTNRLRVDQLLFHLAGIAAQVSHLAGVRGTPRRSSENRLNEFVARRRRAASYDLLRASSVPTFFSVGLVLVVAGVQHAHRECPE